MTRAPEPITRLDEPDVVRLLEARLHNPYQVLGRHTVGDRQIVRVFLPGAAEVWLEDETRPMQRLGDSDLFECVCAARGLPRHYLIGWRDDQGERFSVPDPYSFPPQINDHELQQFSAGLHRQAWQILGAHTQTVDGYAGTRFSVWAPNAERVSVVGDFNLWDGRRHPLASRGESGVWELFVPELERGHYKFEIRNASSGEVLLKFDPYARHSELRPATASIITPPSRYQWRDRAWLEHRAARAWRNEPMSIYEVHPGSWRRTPDGQPLDYRELARQLCDYVDAHGFTHIELLPITEYPFDDSWGYQTTGYFAPTSRFGLPDDFRFFVDHCHRRGIGVIFDWVPAHFPRDEFALARFDGASLYEYHDPWKAEHRDWGTLIFNYERSEVKSFLISSALYWLEEFHLDGLRVDAVASMLYLNFSRQAEQWVPNRFGGHQNLEAIEFLRELNDAVAERCPGSLMIAEESSDWPGVTQATESGGLGFHMKWSMGWMHDTLKYMGKDPIHRSHHQQCLTFGPVFAFNENFVLPLSHDEVVHLKKSMLGKMPGDEWQQFANLRLTYAYQWTYPGKPLMFMGGEFGQQGEWDHRESLPWDYAAESRPLAMQRLVTDLNHLYRHCPAFYGDEFEKTGFEWIDCDDTERSIVSFIRQSGKDQLIVIFNFTPILRDDYVLGMPSSGKYRVIMNTDAGRYGGSDAGSTGSIDAESRPHHGQPASVRLILPPLAALVLQKS